LAAAAIEKTKSPLIEKMNSLTSGDGITLIEGDENV